MHRFFVVFLVVAIGVCLLVFSPKPDPESVSKNLIETVTYLCDGDKTITASYYNESLQGTSSVTAGSVEVALDGVASTTLKQTIFSNGARYTNEDESFAFWSKGDEALVMRNNTMDSAYTNCMSSDSKYVDWNATTTAMGSFRYPDFSYEFISSVAWPPKIERSEFPYTCKTGEERQIAETTYCVTERSEGAAGSVYRTYFYEREGLQAEFTLKFPQCLNYITSQQGACLEEQENLDVDALINDIFTTVSGR